VPLPDPGLLSVDPRRRLFDHLRKLLGMISEEVLGITLLVSRKAFPRATEAEVVVGIASEQFPPARTRLYQLDQRLFGSVARGRSTFSPNGRIWRIVGVIRFLQN
jgi:hypothetical protein